MKPQGNPYYAQKTLFITGFAGSGKSTELVGRADDKTLVLVPTHKAADVLMTKGLKHVYTIHSVLKLVPSIDENFRKKLVTKLSKVGNTDLSGIKSIFIDEYSMINTQILDTLMEALPSSCEVTIFGDPYQLPPITGEAIQLWEPILELTTQYRSKNKECVDLFMRFKDAIKYYKPSPQITIPITKDWTKLFNPDTDRILAFTNKRVQELNHMVGGTKEFKTGNELIANGIPCTIVEDDVSAITLYPSCVSKGKLLDEDKLLLASKKSSTDISMYSTNLGMYKQLCIELDGNNYTVYYDPNYYYTEQRLKKDVEKYQKLVISSNNLSLSIHIPTWCSKNRGAKYVRERGKAWSKYISHRSYIFNLSYPYATTVHKAQGSEFSTVFVDIADMRKALSTEQYQRLVYVAFSRAIDNLILI